MTRNWSPAVRPVVVVISMSALAWKPRPNANQSMAVATANRLAWLIIEILIFMYVDLEEF
jgi:hypothetical protein